MRRRIVEVVCALFLASCGTLMTPGPFPIQVDSVPSGAVVVYEGKQVGVTPCTVPMRRSSTRIEVRLAGHLPQPVDVGVVKNRWVAGNILTLGLGMYVDKAVGAERNPDVHSLEVRLAAGVGPPRATWVRVPDEAHGRGCYGLPEPPGPVFAPRQEERATGIGAAVVGGFFATLVRGILTSLAR